MLLLFQQHILRLQRLTPPFQMNCLPRSLSLPSFSFFQARSVEVQLHILKLHAIEIRLLLQQLFFQV
jgi:hypothetical protein